MRNPENLQDIRVNMEFVNMGYKSHKIRRLWVKIEIT